MSEHSSESDTDDSGMDIRDFNEVRHTESLVRKYQVPPGGQLYAYRSDDGNQHIVVSRGDEPSTRWEKRIPATMERPIPGQKRWTIPDNWDQRLYSSRDNITKSLYYVPESDTWALVDIPTNSWLGDSWYHVKSVGELDIKPVGKLGSSYEIRQLADEYEGSDEGYAEALREVASNWDAVEEELQHAVEWVRDEGLDQMQPGDQPIPTGNDWTVTFQQGYIFRPGEAIKRGVDFSKYEVPLRILLDELRDANALPSSDKFEVGLDDQAINMEYYIRGLSEIGLSPAESIDYFMVAVTGMTQTSWAKERGVSQSTVSENVSKAKRGLSER